MRAFAAVFVITLMEAVTKAGNFSSSALPTSEHMADRLLAGLDLIWSVFPFNKVLTNVNKMLKMMRDIRRDYHLIYYIRDVLSFILSANSV